MSETAERVRNSRKVLGHVAHKRGTPMEDELPVHEGEHYTVLAHTLWADYHVPTVVEWVHGATDSFTDLQESLDNQHRAQIKAHKQAKP